MTDEKKKSQRKKPVAESYEKRMKKKKDPKIKTGRTSPYTPELADLICDRIASEPMSIPRLCKKYDDMPCKTTIYLWLYHYPDFADKYVVAKQSQVKVAMDDAEDLYHSIKPIYDKDGNEKLDSATVTHINNIANHRKWMAKRLAPKMYGDNSRDDDDDGRDSNLENKVDDLLDELNKRKQKDY